MSYSKINSIELIPNIEEAINCLETSKEEELKSAEKIKLNNSLENQLRYMSMTGHLKNKYNESISLLHKLLKLTKTNETIYLSAEDAEILYDYSASYKNRMNKGYR